jgi:hypothetical protein
VIGVQQRIRRVAVDHRGELPTKVDGVLHTHVQALASGREVNVRRVAGEQRAPLAVALGQACGRTEGSNRKYGTPGVDPLSAALHRG